MASHRAQLVYAYAERAFAKRSKSLLMNAPNPRKWWSTVKTAMFGANTRLPPLVDWGGKLVWSGEEKMSLLLAYFDAKQRRYLLSSHNL